MGNLRPRCASRPTGHVMIKAALVSALVVTLACVRASPAAGPKAVEFHAAPNGVDNPQCTARRPCTPQGAFRACRKPFIRECHIQLADGVYFDPEINIYYYRLVKVSGNCANPGAVVLRATKDDATLIWVHDHAIGIITCLSLESTAERAIGLAGRQNAIVDFAFIDFGGMPNGHHISIVEHSTASCVGPNTISGGGNVHASAADMSKLNIGCAWRLTAPVRFSYFLNAVDFSKINAQGATYSAEAAQAPASSAIPGDRPSTGRWPTCLEIAPAIAMRHGTSRPALLLGLLPCRA
ncbi:MAG TPA: hypothetical protein VKE26_20480 [Xanthobacteraceae bacterium]|nr:hypothetical protein [Xanthobacteraceae bacterium]